ncbi:DUF5690 family protein [Asticcacaulis solisilvae]|uniref:DUF5690 family protein n=1 Tax=Asticcacaulis solisilvae TaxID=1217274 RepID=UPI003FD6EC08
MLIMGEGGDMAGRTRAGSGFSGWLDRHPAFLALFGGLMAFGVYFSMYAFRKPFTAASFSDVAGVGIDYKVALVIAQVCGYALSKFIGIKVVSELPARFRSLVLIGLIAVAEIALCLFAVVPAPYNIGLLFLNGLPLGMVWGLVFGFLEGRRTSEVLGSILCASFIVSTGVVQSVGRWLLLNHYATEFTMPAMVGGLFVPLLLVCLWGLNQLPPPNAADIAARVERGPMNGKARAELLAHYAPGLIVLIVLYVLLTALRDFRDNFAAEIWQSVGLGNEPAVFAISDLPIGIVVLLAMATLALFQKNRPALIANLGLIGIGLIITAGVSLAYGAHLIGPLGWMIGLGGGLYLAYTPYNGLLFDRLVAATGRVGTAGFLIYVADSSGYAGSVALLLLKNLTTLNMPWVSFLMISSIVTGIGGLACLAYAMVYLWRKLKA